MRDCALLLVATSFLTACGPSDGGEHVDVDQAEIVGGNEATVGEWPTAVSIDWTGSPVRPWWCGGTIVAPNIVLTAEHCVDDGVLPAQLTVMAGRHNITSGAGTTHAVSSFLMHPTADMALLTLATPVVGVQPTRFVAPARVVEVPPGSTTTIVGWGNLSEGGTPSATLQEVEVEVVATGSACEMVTAYPSGGVSVTAGEICIGEIAGGQDSCQGDSGGPVFVNRDGEFFLLGVTSEGHGCARPNLPGVYALVPDAFTWLHDNIAGEPAPSLLPTAQLSAAVHPVFLL